MAKTAVTDFWDRFKRLSDYDVTDSDLDTLILDFINYSLKLMKQWFRDAGMYDEIGTNGTIDTTADQAYVDIATNLPDIDEILVQSERTNDKTIQVISYEQYKHLFPDPTASSSETPDFATTPYNGRIYFGPTPSGVLTIYFDYVKLLDDITASDDLPFEGKYDPLLDALCRKMFLEYIDISDQRAINAANNNVLFHKRELMKSTNRYENNQMASRSVQLLGPQGQSTSPVYGYGIAGYGIGGYGGYQP